MLVIVPHYKQPSLSSLIDIDMMKKIDIQAIKTRFDMIGNSSQLNHSIEVAVQVAPTDLSVYIIGESGVGKEIFSQIIHKMSLRKHEPFIAINCGAIPEGTIDSELFGHEKGSFTGAEKEREGYFEKVNGGTIFLDEIGEMPLGTQSRLLRILETGEYIRVGSSAIRKTDVRVIVATNRDLYEEVQKRKFRKDLFYRLNTIPIYVPPLRERRDDIPLLFKKFCIDFAKRYHSTPLNLTDDAVNMIKNYPWDGNVRQLKNVAEQISVLEHTKIVDGEIIKHYLPDTPQQMMILRHDERSQTSELDMLYKIILEMKNELNVLKKAIFDTEGIPLTVTQPIIYKEGNMLRGNDTNVVRKFPPPSDTLQQAIPIASPYMQPSYQQQHIDRASNFNIAEMEKELIIRALNKNNGRKRNAALDLGISERTLYRKIRDYNIEV